MMKNGIFETVEKLHTLQLYDDLIFYSEVGINENKIAESVKIDEQAYVCSCIGDAYSESSNLCQSEKWYDHCIHALATIKRQGLDNRFDEIINMVEVRFRLHKVLVKARRFDKALKCLEAIPKAECPPKVQYAIVKLNMRYRKIDKTEMSNRQSMLSNLRTLTKQVPEAFYCKSMLVLAENAKASETDQLVPKYKNNELTAWFAAKQAESRRNFPLALSHLSKFFTSDNFMLITEMAHYHRVIGDKRKAMDLYEKAHTMSRSMMHGMDGYSALLFQAKRNKELEALVENLMSCNLHTYETYIALAYLSRVQRRPRDAILSLAQRAISLANSGRQRAEVLLLKGQIYMETKRFKECDIYCHEAHIHDSTNVEAYDLHVHSLRCQKMPAKAFNLVKTAMESLGDSNQRIQYLMALILADNITTATKAIENLEKVVEKAPFMTDALNLLMHMYERNKQHEKGMKLARKFLEVHADTGARKILNDFLLKYSQPVDRTPNSTLKSAEHKGSAKAGSSAEIMSSGGSMSPSNSSSIFSGRGALPPPPIAPVRMRRLVQPYQSRRAASVTSSQSLDIGPLDIGHFSPPVLDESVEMLEEWIGSSSQQSSSDTISNSPQSSITGNTQLAHTRSSGVTTRAARRNSSLYITTPTSSASRSNIPSLHASTEAIAASLDYDRQQRIRRRNLTAVRERELARAIHSQQAHNERMARRQQQQQAQQALPSPHSILPSPVSTRAIHTDGLSTPQNRGISDNFSAELLDEESRGGLEEEEEVDDIAETVDDAEFFAETSDHPDGDFIVHDNDNEVEMMDDDSDEYSERVVM